MHTFKELSNEIDIVDVSKKKYAIESERKIKWAVNMYDMWQKDHIGKLDVPLKIRNADLSVLYSFTQDDLAFVLSRLIKEIKK